MVAKLRTHNSQPPSACVKRSMPSGGTKLRCDAEERDLLLKIVGQVVRPVVVTQPQPTGHAFADAPEAFADALADRLQGLEAGPALGMKTDALGRAVVNGHEDKGWPLGDLTVAVMSVPHITSGASVVMVPSCAFGPCA